MKSEGISNETSSGEKSQQDETSPPIEPSDFETSGSFDGVVKPLPHQNNLNVTVKTDNVNIHASHLAALEAICAQSPEIAAKIIDSTEETAKYDYRRYRIGAISAAVIASTILICSTIVVVTKGFWAGIAFFLACAAASAIVSAIFTGKSQDLSWTVKLLGHSNDKQDEDDDPQQ